MKCKDCSRRAAAGKRRCKACSKVHSQRERARRDARRNAGLCVVCGEDAVTEADHVLTLCELHRQHYVQRDAARRLALKETPP